MTFFNLDTKNINSINELVNTHKNGIKEHLFILCKETAGDYDLYIESLNRLSKELSDGYLDGYYTAEGEPVTRWKPFNQQLAILKTIAKEENLSERKLKALAERRAERQKKRIAQSGTYNDRQKFQTDLNKVTYSEKFGNTDIGIQNIG